MGIPSFYRHLCKRHPKLISSIVSSPAWLCLDFNCAMYYVLHAYQKEHPYTDTKKIEWEAGFCNAIVAYMEEIIAIAKPTEGVFVGCDGAVCAAKRRQQRLRRFKGPWTSTWTAKLLNQPITEKWNQNALTPGTQFMSALGDALKSAGSRIQKTTGLQIHISTTEESGEGEHKLMRFIHQLDLPPSSCLIYGLDADLILLALHLVANSSPPISVSLLREAQEFEGGGGGGGKGQWRTLDINGLQQALLGTDSSTENTNDFIAAMTLLGNDFLPRSLTHTVRDNGIPDVIKTLRTCVWAKGKRIVEPDTGSVSVGGLLYFISDWATTEQQGLTEVAVRAQKAAHWPTRQGDSPEETALNEWNATPTQWATVSQLLHPGFDYSAWHPGTPENYIQGVAWVWDYYCGKPVDCSWVFEEHLPPLWTSIEQYLLHQYGLLDKAVVDPPICKHTEPLQDTVHLLSVLPMQSVEELVLPALVTWAYRHPWYWPSSWALHDVGKGQIWECEPILPLIPESVLRGIKLT